MIPVWALSFVLLNYTLGFPIFNTTRIQSSPFCLLATCSLSNLGSSLQMGDERAGDLTNDPMGIGKK
ncbi:uncharacterized protein zgc:193726 [Triplophysa rosa]|uniref:uncharacterized protein zgc:193726 n=1 Tax=Triplophysa rosa TaxID=992332 RepID=UPI002545C09D|nr:uncharacterized protein zgc:193726 [Triplophysa rosa]